VKGSYERLEGGVNRSYPIILILFKLRLDKKVNSLDVTLSEFT
jgi:hypothetical protein